MTKIVTEEWKPETTKFQIFDKVRVKEGVDISQGYIGKEGVVVVNTGSAPEGMWPLQVSFEDGSEPGFNPWELELVKPSSPDALKQAWEELEAMEEQPLDIVAAWKETNPKCLSKSSAFSTQVGGNHYKDLPIQPVEFILANGLGFCEGNVVKYICRYKQKNGIQDLKKVIHYAQLLIEDLEKGK